MERTHIKGVLNPFEHLRWIFLQKYLTAKSSQKAQSFDRVLTTPLHIIIIIIIIVIIIIIIIITIIIIINHLFCHLELHYVSSTKITWKKRYK